VTKESSKNLTSRDAKSIVSAWLKLLARSQSNKCYCSDKQDFSVFLMRKKLQPLYKNIWFINNWFLINENLWFIFSVSVTQNDALYRLLTELAGHCLFKRSLFLRSALFWDLSSAHW